MSRKARVIGIDFASVNFRLIEAVRAGLFAAAVALACVLAALVATAARDRGRAAGLDRQIDGLLASEEKLRPAMQERQQIVKNLAEMSSLIDARRTGWTRLLTAIEEVFPAGAALNRIEFMPRERAVALEGVATSPEALSRLMIGLQRSLDIRNPQLKRQSMEKGVLSFNVTFNYHEIAAVPAGQGAARRARR